MKYIHRHGVLVQRVGIVLKKGDISQESIWLQEAWICEKAWTNQDSLLTGKSAVARQISLIRNENKKQKKQRE